jgi:hypothetical protein
MLTTVRSEGRPTDHSVLAAGYVWPQKLRWRLSLRLLLWLRWWCTVIATILMDYGSDYDADYHRSVANLRKHPAPDYSDHSGWSFWFLRSRSYYNLLDDDADYVQIIMNLCRMFGLMIGALEWSRHEGTNESGDCLRNWWLSGRWLTGLVN